MPAWTLCVSLKASAAVRDAGSLITTESINSLVGLGICGPHELFLKTLEFLPYVWDTDNFQDMWTNTTFFLMEAQ